MGTFYKYINIIMCPGLIAKQRIDPPASINEHFDSCIFECRYYFNSIL